MNTASTLAMLLASVVVGPVMADEVRMPSDVVIEALTKSSLMTFNDAALTGDYSVLYSQLGKDLHEQQTPDKLKTIFFDQFKNSDFTMVAGLPLGVHTSNLTNGLLTMDGEIKLSEKSSVKYTLGYVMEASDWKLSAINVSVSLHPVGDGKPGYQVN